MLADGKRARLPFVLTSKARIAHGPNLSEAVAFGKVCNGAVRAPLQERPPPEERRKFRNGASQYSATINTRSFMPGRTE